MWLAFWYGKTTGDSKLADKVGRGGSQVNKLRAPERTSPMRNDGLPEVCTTEVITGAGTISPGHRGEVSRGNVGIFGDLSTGDWKLLDTLR